MKLSKTSLISLAALGLVAAAAPALAAAPDWVPAVTEGVDSLSSGTKEVAAPIIGLCIGIFGLWGCMSGHIDW